MKFGKVLHIIIAVFVALLIGGHLLINDSRIQQKAAGYATHISSSMLQTDVDASSIRFKYPFGIEIDGLTVYDTEKDTLAHIAAATVYFKPMQLLKHKLAISSLRLYRPDVRIHADSIGAVPNCAFLADALKGNGGNSSMTIRANSIVIRNGAFRYDILDQPETENVFNSSHVGIRRLSASISLKTIDTDTISLAIRKLHANEKSGFVLSDVRGGLSAGPHSMAVSNLKLSSRSSSLKIDRLTAECGLKDRITAIPRFSSDIVATVRGSDFKAFVPALASMSDNVDLSLKTHGDSSRIYVSSLSLKSGQDAVFLLADGSMVPCGFQSLPDFDARISGTVGEGMPAWFDSQLASAGIVLPSQCRGLGHTTLSASASHKDDRLYSDISIKSELAGNADIHVNGEGNDYRLHTTAGSIALNTITGISLLGRCDLDMDATVSTAGGHYTGKAVCNASRLTIAGYEYRNVAINGGYNGDSIDAKVIFSDRNGAVSLNAGMIPGSTPTYSVRMRADDVNLAAYSNGKTDSLTVSSYLLARLSGNDIDNLNGTVSVDSLIITRPDGRSWNSDNLTACMEENAAGTRTIALASDFIDLALAGDYSFKTLKSSFLDMTGYVLPTISESMSAKSGSRKYHNRKNNNNIVLNANVCDLGFMDVLFGKPVSLGSPASVRLQLCDADSTMSCDLDIPSVTFQNNTLRDVNMTLGTGSDHFSARIDGSRISPTGQPTDIGASIYGRPGQQDVVYADLALADAESGMNLPVKAKISFDRYQPGQGLGTMIHIDPTSIAYNGNTWNLSVDSIHAAGQRFSLANFTLGNDMHYLMVDGNVSSDSADVVNLWLNRIDLDQTLSAFNANKMQLKGSASGNLSVSSLLGNPAFTGGLEIEEMEFQNSLLGHVSSKLEWNSDMERIDISAIARDTVSSTAFNGYYIPENSYIDMAIAANHTDLRFLNQWTKSVFSELGGRAVGNLRLFGRTSALDIEGQSILENGYFVQDALNTTFIIREDTLWFEPGRMLFTNVNFFDEYGHDGLMDCRLTHTNFRDWKVDMTANVADMLVYNVPKTDKTSLYAQVYAEGSVDLSFNGTDGLNVKVDANTSNGTRLGYQQTSASVEDYGLLTIVSRDGHSQDDMTADPGNAAGKGSGKFNLDLNVVCNDAAILDMSLGPINGTFRGSGNISVKYNPSDGPVLNGVYNLSYGQCYLSLEDLIRKEFLLRDGSYVRFNGAPLNTELNLLTYHNVNSVSIYDLDPTMSSSSNNVRVRCLMDVTGNAGDPQLSFDIDMPSGTSEEKDILASATSTEEQRNIQFMYLLAIGCFYSYDVNNQSDAMSPSVMESILNSTVSGQINNVLSQMLHSEAISLSSNLSASSYLSNDATNLNNKELEGILEAHLLDNRLLVNGNFGYRENTINNTSNFIGDVEVRYLLFPKLGISLKGYNKSNDKYFSKTTLTTQGIGLVFERDF